MVNFIAEHWVSLIFGMLSAGLLGYFRHLYTKFQKAEKQEKEELKAEIRKEYEEKMKTLKLEMQQELATYKDEVRKDIDALKTDNARFERYFAAIRESWCYRYTSLCEAALEKGSVTTKEYMQLNEMWKVYSGIDGNGQGAAYHNKTETLTVTNKEEGSDK